MGALEKLREGILPHWNKKHDQHWEKETSNWNPRYAKAYEQVSCLEQSEGGNCFEGNRLNEGSMILLQHPGKQKPGLDVGFF